MNSMELGTLKKLTYTVFAAVKEAGPEGIPSGHLYAMLMGKVDMPTYNWILDLLSEGKMISRSGHLLKVVR